MLPVSFAAIIFTLGLSVFLNTSFHGFKDYNHQIKDLSNWQETSLASAKRVSIESSNLLNNIKTQLNSCLEEYNMLDTQEKRAGFECETDFQSNIEDFKASLIANKANQLNNTIQYGLNPDKTGKAYEKFNYKLYHSDKLPSALTKGDDLYNSVLVKSDQLSQEININDFEYYLDFENLNIDAKFLKALVGENNFNIISVNPNQFNVSLSGTDFLKENKLPNAIKLVIDFKQRESLRDEGEAISKKETLAHTLFAVGQLRANEASAVVVKIPEPPSCNGVCGTANCPPCPPPPPPVNGYRHQITFGQFSNVSGRGIYFDNSQPASAQNQINIVNTNQNRFTSVYPDAGNFLNINIGTLPPVSSVLISNRNQGGTDFSKVDFATVSFETNVPPGRTLNITESSNLNVDIVPRARKRYMTAQKDFRVNGRLIPAGTVLVGTLKPNSIDNNIKFNDFANVKAYNADTGALIQIFKPGDQNSNDCSGGGVCMNINQFAPSANSPNLPAAHVLTSFSTAQLFPGKPFDEANRLFVNVQSNLESNSVLGIYGGNKSWQEKIRDGDLNSELETLKTKFFNVNNDDVTAPDGDDAEILDAYFGMFDRSSFAGQAEFAAAFGINYLATGDTVNDTLQRNMIISFNKFIDQKKDVFDIYSQVNANKNHSDYKKAKKIMLDVRQDLFKFREIHQAVLKSQISKNKASERNNKLVTSIKAKDSGSSVEIIAVVENNNSQNTSSGNNSSNNNNSTTVNNASPLRPSCMNKKPKNRKNPKKCKNKIQAYLAAGGVR